ncbi:unnamed protein product, partial [Rotaria sordida]
MLRKNRKQAAENYDFGDIEKVPSNIENIMEKNFVTYIYLGIIFCLRICFLSYIPAWSSVMANLIHFLIGIGTIIDQFER